MRGRNRQVVVVFTPLIIASRTIVVLLVEDQATTLIKGDGEGEKTSAVLAGATTQLMRLLLFSWHWRVPSCQHCLDGLFNCPLLGPIDEHMLIVTMVVPD